MLSSIFEAVEHLTFPIRLLLLSMVYLPGTILSLLKNGQYSTLLSPSGFRYAWFARFLTAYGPSVKEDVAPQVGPLVNRARGIVLDVGPGSGEWIGLFDKEKVTKACLSQAEFGIIGCGSNCSIRSMVWSPMPTITRL